MTGILQLFVDLEFGWLVFCGLLWLWARYVKHWSEEMLLLLILTVYGSALITAALPVTLFFRALGIL